MEKNETDNSGQEGRERLLYWERWAITEQELRGLVQKALERRRPAVVFALARRFLAVMESAEEKEGVQDSQASGQWIRIESLSQLRAVVGGRFQNLRQRWIAAGFPLREHRGDREAEAKLNYEGWVALAAWIGKQGCEVKLAAEGMEWLFEVRPVLNR